MGSALKSLRLLDLGKKISGFEDRIFTAHRGRLYAYTVAALNVAILAYEILIKGRSVIDLRGKQACIDFCTIWVSGKFAASTDPARVYNYPAFSVAQAALVGPHHANFPPYHFFYPPTFLLFTYPLGMLPYLVAFAVWTVGTLLLYLAAVHAILPRPVALFAAITPFTVPENILLGNNGLLTAALIGLSLAYLERRPSVSGILLGLLTYKPHFGVLFPFALLASRNWRAVGSATATSVMLAVIATIAFGFEGWPEVIESLRDRTAGLSTDEGLVLTLQSVFGLLQWAGASPAISWIAQGFVAAMVILAMCAIWTKPIPHSLKAATLSICSVMVTPYVQIYDLCILTIAVAFLVGDGLSRGFLSGERTIILICWSALLLLLRPFGSVIEVLILILIARRIVAYRRHPVAGSGGAPAGYALSVGHCHE